MSRSTFRTINKYDLDLTFDIVKYLKYNFIIETKDYKARPNFIVKTYLYEEIESAINLKKSKFFKEKKNDKKFNAIINATFKNNPEFCTAGYGVRDPNGQVTKKQVFKNLKRKNTNNFSNINDDISEDESISDEDKEWKKYKLVMNINYVQ